MSKLSENIDVIGAKGSPKGRYIVISLGKGSDQIDRRHFYSYISPETPLARNFTIPSLDIW